MIDNNELNRDIINFGRKIFKSLGKEQPSVFNKSFFHSKLLKWSLDKPNFKNNLFRLVDVLPTLKKPSSVSQHIYEYLDSPIEEISKFFSTGTKLIKTGLIPSIFTSFAVKQGVQQMADLFIAGETPKKALPTIKKILNNGQTFTVDLLGEYSVSEVESEEYLNRYLDAIEVIANESKSWTPKWKGFEEHSGTSRVVNVSIKLSALYSQCNVLNMKKSIEILSERLSILTRKAKELDIGLYVDAEDTANNIIIYEVFKNVFSNNEFINFDRPGIVIQAYAKNSQETLEDMLNLAKKRNGKIAIRLVKGAYWDLETVTAKQNHWQSPLFSEKYESDINFEKLSKFLLDNIDYFYPAFGSHNIRSLSHACCYAKQNNISSNNFELQMLYGMASPIANAYRNEGYFVRLYVPLGNLLPGMGYLVRRLLENTSNESFLKHTFFDDSESDKLLEDPSLSN